MMMVEDKGMMMVEDKGTDLIPGQVVWCKHTIESVTENGDAKCVYSPRPGHNEYAANSINAIFLWREDDMSLEFPSCAMLSFLSTIGTLLFGACVGFALSALL